MPNRSVRTQLKLELGNIQPDDLQRLLNTAVTYAIQQRATAATAIATSISAQTMYRFNKGPQFCRNKILFWQTRQAGRFHQQPQTHPIYQK